MDDALVPPDVELDRDPLVAVERGRGRGGAVALGQHPVELDVRTRRAEVRGGPLARPRAAQELHLDGDREILVDAHGPGRL